MRIVTIITQSAVIDQILTHLRTRSAAGAVPRRGCSVYSLVRRPRLNFGSAQKSVGKTRQ
jgi:hypothetical protein